MAFRSRRETTDADAKRVGAVASAVEPRHRRG
jgi:hypothetical protein